VISRPEGVAQGRWYHITLETLSLNRRKVPVRSITVHFTVISKSSVLLRCYLWISKGKKICIVIYVHCYKFCILLCSLCWSTHLLIQLLVAHWKSSLNHLHDVRIVSARVPTMTRRVPVIPQADLDTLPQVLILQV
jgi:hypothetical protein